MPYLSASARGDWEQFRSDNPTTLASPTNLMWLLPDLYRASIVSAQQHSTIEHRLSDETLALLAKENDTPNPVSLY